MLLDSPTFPAAEIVSHISHDGGNQRSPAGINNPGTRPLNHQVLVRSCFIPFYITQEVRVRKCCILCNPTQWVLVRSCFNLCYSTQEELVRSCFILFNPTQEVRVQNCFILCYPAQVERVQHCFILLSSPGGTRSKLLHPVFWNSNFIPQYIGTSNSTVLFLERQL